VDRRQTYPPEPVPTHRIGRNASDAGARAVAYRGPVLESYSVQARRAVSLATAESRRLGHGRVGTEHLLLGLLAEGASATAQTLQAHGASLAAARHKVVEATGADAGDEAPADPELTPRARRALDRAGRFSRQDREPEVRPEHLLLGVLDVEGLACQVLRGLGVDLARLREALVPGEAVPAVVEREADPRAVATVRPHCPSCLAALDETLMAVLMPARHDGDSHATTVRVVFCAGCGAALGAVPAHR
jgi:ATP-dependent Clp protease ATP-binding subunit ClpA